MQLLTKRSDFIGELFPCPFEHNSKDFYKKSWSRVASVIKSCIIHSIFWEYFSRAFTSKEIMALLHVRFFSETLNFSVLLVLCIWNKYDIISFTFDLSVAHSYYFFPSCSGLKQSEAESCYINIARTLEFYGVELHSGRVCLHCNFSLGK